MALWDPRTMPMSMTLYVPLYTSTPLLTTKIPCLHRASMPWHTLPMDFPRVWAERDHTRLGWGILCWRTPQHPLRQARCLAGAHVCRQKTLLW
jgi:hypothetical protein